MIRGFVFLLVLGILFSVSGCTMSDVLGINKDETISYEPKAHLTAEENYALKQWTNAAETADQVGDFTTAALYYAKIADYFPDTKEGKKALKRLDQISPKPDVAG